MRRSTARSYDKGGRTQTQWAAPDGTRHFTYETYNNPSKTAKLVISWFPTPEQAIAATLGAADNAPTPEWGRIITGLIAAHYDNDEERFKERAVKAAKMYDEAGKYEVAEYVMEQYSSGMAFIPM